MVLKLKGFVRTKNERRENTLNISEIMKSVSCSLGRLQNSVLVVSSSNPCTHQGVGSQPVCALWIMAAFCPRLWPPFYLLHTVKYSSGKSQVQWLQNKKTLQADMCLVRFEELSHVSSEYLWNWESHDMSAYEIYLELKPLVKKIPRRLWTWVFNSSAFMPICWVPSHPQQSLCINTPDIICLPADRILRCLHGQNLEKWGYCANHFRSEFGPNPELALSEVASLHEMALHGGHHSRNNPNEKQM